MASNPDFIVVGGGTAGLVVAARLTENPNVRVLVIEAGEDQLENQAISIPALWPSLLGTELDWAFSSVPQTALTGRSIGYPLGRLLGGSSGLNTQAFVALSQDATDMWKELGNPQWDSKTLAPYFERSHTLTLPSDDTADYLGLDYLKSEEHKGRNGPIQCSYSDTIRGQVGKAWTDAFKTLGYGLSGDPWAANVTGGYANATTVDPVTKTRSYSASAYYASAKSRPNLEVATGIQIDHITFQNVGVGGNVVATEVIGSKSGTPVIYRAKKEIILAAGALNTPKILELSGIGNPAILQQHCIQVVVDNPHVGENFQDHPQCGWSFEVRDDVETLDQLIRKDPTTMQKAMEEFQQSKKGPFSRGAVNNHAILPVMDFVKEGQGLLQQTVSKYLSPSSHSAHLYLPQQAVDFVQKVISSDDIGSMNYIVYAAQGNFGSDSSEARNVTHVSLGGNFVTIAGFLCYPLSRGSVHIRSANPSDMPAIDPKLLDHPLDLEIYARHIRYIEEIARSEPMRKILKENGRRHPSFADFHGDLDATKAYLKKVSISAWHPCGTCAMRPREQGGVLDQTLKVYGTSNVRVVDASMVPFICRGNTQSLVYAVAERASDLIKDYWGI